MKVKLWESKERCIPRARFERPKAFRFQDTSEHGCADTYPIVKNASDYPHSIPRKEMNPAFFTEVNRVCFSPVFEQRVTASGKLNKQAKKSVSRLGLEHANMTREASRVSQRRKKMTMDETSHQVGTISSGVNSGKKNRPNSPSKLPHVQVELDLSVLFAGYRHVTTRGKVNQTALQLGSGVRDMFVTFSIDRDLLTPMQKEILNPLVFKINHVDTVAEKVIFFWKFIFFEKNFHPLC